MAANMSDEGVSMIQKRVRKCRQSHCSRMRERSAYAGSERHRNVLREGGIDGVVPMAEDATGQRLTKHLGKGCALETPPGT